MKSAKALLEDRTIGLILIATGFFVANLCAQAQGVHLSITQPGGMPGMPTITAIEPLTNGVRITWDGPSGYYQLFRKLGLSDPTWLPVGARTNLARTAAITNDYVNALFRVSGPAPQYAGSQACLECHEDIHNLEMNTRHAQALETLKQVDQDQNPSCLPCHTVGYGLPTGYSLDNPTPRLAGVQCENCHGPAANHAANPDDFIARPRVELAGQVCGGCHTGSHHPTFDEWSSSGHFQVVEDMNPSGRINSCARCHSGSSRLALLQGEDPGIAVTNDANVGIVCITCHDPHRVTANPAQLRNPVFSTNDYFLSTSDVFTNKYDPDINVCAQCHNHRGASWSSSSRPPHHSPQYNMLLGTVGERAPGASTNAQPAAHALIEKQCVTCHMQSEEYESESQPAVTGHRFEVHSYQACADCHGSAANAQNLTAFLTGYVSNRVQEVKGFLDQWATTQAPLSLRTNYGTRAWEYSTPGDLSPGGSGPNSSEQAQIPSNIKKARFNLYLVLYDGSFGVHNAPYSLTLLDTARNWVFEELYQ